MPVITATIDKVDGYQNLRVSKSYRLTIPRDVVNKYEIEVGDTVQVLFQYVDKPHITAERKGDGDVSP